MKAAAIILYKQVEIQNEMRSYRPRRTANLWQWAPLLNL